MVGTCWFESERTSTEAGQVHSHNLLYDEDWLYRAYRSVKTNSGSTTAGVDGLKMFDFEEDLEANLRALRQDLKSEAFVPKPVRRTYQGCHYTAIASGKRCKDEGVRPSMEQ